MRISATSGRHRTSSQSSVEIHVSEAVTSTACMGAVPSNTQPLLFKPNSSFGEVLRLTGAVGCITPQGEVFTLKQLCFYVKKYVRDRQLYDLDDPRIVHCANDPIGRAFSVKTFTVDEAVGIVMRNTIPVDLEYPRSPRVLSTPPPSSVSQTTVMHYDSDLHGVGSVKNNLTAPNKQEFPTTKIEIEGSVIKQATTEGDTNVSLFSSPTISQLSSSGVPPKHPAVQEKSDDESNSLVASYPGSSLVIAGCSGESLTKTAVTAASASVTHAASASVTHAASASVTAAEKGRTDRKLRDKHMSESSPDDQLSQRKRQSSLSIVYDGRGEERSYQIDIKVTEDSDVESILSVQSKETVLVRDSSDDYWFVTSDEDGEQISVTMSHDGVSVEVGEMEEYEVESLSSEASTGFITDSPDEEICVMIESEDFNGGFWADSESSDAEPDSHDEDIKEGDLWLCEKCQLKNRPFRRFCEKCWNIRPGWLASDLPNSAKSVPTTPRRYSPHDSPYSANRARHRQRMLRTNSSAQRRLNLGASQSQRDAGTAESREGSFISIPHLEEAVRREQSALNFNSESQRSDASLPSHSSLSQNRQDTVVLENRSVITAAQVSVSGENSTTASSTPSLMVSDSGLGSSFASSQGSVVSLMSSKQLLSDDVFSPGTPASTSMSCQNNSSPDLKSPSQGKNSGASTSAMDVVKNKTSSSHSAPVACRKSVDIVYPTRIRTECLSSFSQPSTSQCSTPGPLPSPRKRRPMALPTEPYSPAANSPKKMRLNSPAKSAFPFPNSDLMSNFSPRKVNFPSSPRKRFASLSDYNESCMVCMSRPKEASIIHGKTGHQVCCYLCAKKLKRRGRPCPVCRRPIQKVIRNFIA